MECREHAGVGTPEVAEVEVAGVLATEDRAGLRHRGLDERVAHPSAYGNAPVLGHDLGDRTRGDEVVDDRGARVLGELAYGDERRQRGRVDDVTALVDHEAAIGVAVEREAEIGAGLAHLGLQVAHVVGLDRVGLMVGEGAVELEEQRRDRQREAGEHRRHCVSAHAVAGIDDDVQVPDGVQRDEGAQEGGVVGEHISLRHGAVRAVEARHALSRPGQHEVLDLPQAGVLAHGGRTDATELDAVVLRRVVAGGEHRARKVERAGGVIELVGRGEPDLDDVHALRGHALGEGCDQIGAGGAHVVAHDHRTGSPVGH